MMASAVVSKATDDDDGVLRATAGVVTTAEVAEGDAGTSVPRNEARE